MAKKKPGRGRPPKDRTVKASSLVWGNDAQDRFRKALNEVRPVGYDSKIPAILQQNLLDRWPAPPEIDPVGHVCIDVDSRLRCLLCIRRRRFAEAVLRRFELKKNGRAVQWAVGLFIGAMDIWFRHPRRKQVDKTFDEKICSPTLTDDHWLKIPAITQNSIPVGVCEPPDSEHEVTSEKPSETSDSSEWLIGFPRQPGVSDIRGWTIWREESCKKIWEIGTKGIAYAKAIEAEKRCEPYPSNVHVRLFAWFQVGGWELEKAAEFCRLSLSRPQLSRITDEVAVALGVDKREARGRPKKLHENTH